MKGRLVAAGSMAVIAAMLAAACQTSGGRPDNETEGAGVDESALPGDQVAQASNPVWPSNFPDPQILPDGAGFVAIATNGNGMNVQTLTSDDLRTWTQGSDAMPELASWTTPGKVWAPEAAKFGERWVMYYTTRAPNPEIQCIGVAVASQPRGPYRDTTSAPLVCEEDHGGSIDASPFIASDGRAFLYWKNDGNAVGMDTWISVQELASDGLSLLGESQRLLKQDQPWEGQLVEAPFMWERDGVFHLFYSANDYGSDRYAVGHATASSPTGPFTKDPEPVLTSSAVAAGPGHCALFENAGRVLMVYHAWVPDSIGSEPPGRTMWLSEVTFDGRSVAVTPPRTELPRFGSGAT